MSVSKQKEISTALNQFYQKPIALVSLELLLSVGLVIFLAVFAIQPTLMTMSDLIKEREDKQKLADQLEKKIAALQTAQNLYMQITPQLPLLDDAIPQRPQLIKALKIIEKLATENNVILEGMNVSSIPDETPSDVSPQKIQRINIAANFSLEGDYLSIKNFIEALRNSRRSYPIDTVSFGLEENRGTKKLRTSITLNIPYLGVPEK